MINELLNLIKEIDITGSELNTIKSELRIKEFELKTKKLELEFSPEFTEGLKVKEIAPKVHEATLEESREICELKQKRDDKEHELMILKLQFQYTKEVIDSQKQ